MVEAEGGEVLVRLKVVPGGSRDAVMGEHGDRVRVKVSAAPEGGRANEAVMRLLAERLEVARSALRLVHGPTGPLKTVAVRGLSSATVRSRLGAAP